MQFQKKRCVAMLLAGGQGSRLMVLTENTAKPAVPFGGKYRIIDFPLSNCVNSKIDTVGILTQYQPLELNEYIGNGQPWGLNSSHGGVQVLPPYAKSKNSEWYKGTANAIYQNIDWQQILLHMFNLIILTGGLYFLLYQPVTAFMKKRQEYYAGLEADAQAKLQEAEQKVREADETLSGMQAEAEQLRADAMKQADAEAAARLAGADAEKQKILAAAKAQAAREKDAMLREANEQIGALVSNAVDKLVSDADDPYADFLHAVKRGA